MLRSLFCKQIRALPLAIAALMLAYIFVPCVQAEDKPESAKRVDLLNTHVVIPQRDHFFLASRIALYGSVAADLGTTWHGMSKGHVEANPLLGQNRVRQGAIVIGSTVALDVLSRSLHRAGHTKLAKVLNFMIAGEHTFAATHNFRQIHLNR